MLPLSRLVLTACLRMLGGLMLLTGVLLVLLVALGTWREGFDAREQQLSLLAAGFAVGGWIARRCARLFDPLA